MMPTQLLYEHIQLRADGAAVIMPSGFKVRMLVQMYLSGSSVEDLQEDYPFLTFGQIHSALAYYWDHKVAVDAQIAASHVVEAEFLEGYKPSFTRAELQERLAQR
jgi:uncharacterized protein (DUF433 family)